MVKLDTLKENDKNVRKISDEHFEMLRKSVSKRASGFQSSHRRLISSTGVSGSM